jgi:hypothetical protein
MQGGRYSDQYLREDDVIYENERRLPFTSSFSEKHLLKVDRYAWSDETGRVKKVPSEYKPPHGWEWDEG